VNYQHKGNKTN